MTLIDASRVKPADLIRIAGPVSLMYGPPPAIVLDVDADFKHKLVAMTVFTSRSLITVWYVYDSDELELLCRPCGG